MYFNKSHHTNEYFSATVARYGDTLEIENHSLLNAFVTFDQMVLFTRSHILSYFAKRSNNRYSKNYCGLYLKLYFTLQDNPKNVFRFYLEVVETDFDFINSVECLNNMKEKFENVVKIWQRKRELLFSLRKNIVIDIKNIRLVAAMHPFKY